MKQKKYIIHVDMDAFFASVEQRDNSKFRGRPVIVGANPKNGKGRGVVSTCSYEARRFGIHSAMPISIAFKRCPDAVFLPVDMKKYAQVSEQIFDILYDFTPEIEPVSIDEAFLDITGSYRIFGSPFEVCKQIKLKIKNELNLNASVGLASIKMAAKIASDLNKPDGLLEIREENLLVFLWPLGVDSIPGLGGKTKDILKKRGIEKIGDLAKRDPKELIRILGKNGLYFWKLANGVDDRAVKASDKAKSISNEFTFLEDTADIKKIESKLLALCEKVSTRLRQQGLKGKTIGLKVRFEGFNTYTRAVTIQEASNFVEVIYTVIKNLYYDSFKKSTQKVRLIGVKVSTLIPINFSDTLFKEDAFQEKEKLYKAVDKIKERFGDKAIYRAGSKVL